jgi:hypothetical protein
VEANIRSHSRKEIGRKAERPAGNSNSRCFRGNASG